VLEPRPLELVNVHAELNIGHVYSLEHGFIFSEPNPHAARKMTII
jgi:hypothetical protein